MPKGKKITLKEKNENTVIGGGEKDSKPCIIEYSKYTETIAKQEVSSGTLINYTTNVTVDRYIDHHRVYPFKINNKYVQRFGQ